jgi:uncharacterized membrane protein HdeD (DUF308 family)
MPILIAALVVAVLLGLFAQRRTAMIGTAIACAGVLFTFTWAVADGRGNDPWWIMLIALAGCALALVLAATLPMARHHVRS